jgi:putative salt-induced outer membrane protein
LKAHHRLLAAALPALIAASAATKVRADDSPPPPPPEHTWIGKGQIGFLESKGNSNAESINGNVDITRYDNPWKNEIVLLALYGKTTDIVSAERYEVREQTNYNITSKLFAFGGLRYEHDLFDGFQYQRSVAGGMGFKFVDLKTTTLSAQVGAGYRQLRPETIDYASNGSGQVIGRNPLQQENEAIGTLEIDFMHKFNDATTLTNKLYTEYGSSNTMATDAIQLAVKMTTKLALVVGYTVIDNTDPAPPLKKVDQLTTVNLQFSF